MAEYSIASARSARHELEVLDPAGHSPHPSQDRILAQIPRPHGARKLTGEKHLWRIRIGDYRVIYAILDTERRIDITAVRHRREAYE